MNRYRQRRERMNKFVDLDLAHHKMTKRSPCRAWVFQRVTKKGPQWCPYGFKFVWTPGMFQLMGDIDELTITHYISISNDLRESLQWLYTGHFEYLAGKSNIRQQYDDEATADRIWQELMETAREHLQAYREDVREWRGLCAEIRAENSILLADNELPDRPERPAEIDQPFHCLARALDVSFESKVKGSAYGSRKYLRKLLVQFLHTEQDAADLTRELFGDPIVICEWPQNLERQIAAMKFAANQILLAEFESSWSDRVVDWLIKIAPRWGLSA